MQNQSVTAGRKLHNYWNEGAFTPIKLENGRIGALCDECGNILKNTTKSRLQTHRRICVPNIPATGFDCSPPAIRTFLVSDESNSTDLLDDGASDAALMNKTKLYDADSEFILPVPNPVSVEKKKLRVEKSETFSDSENQVFQNQGIEILQETFGGNDCIEIAEDSLTPTVPVTISTATALSSRSSLHSTRSSTSSSFHPILHPSWPSDGCTFNSIIPSSSERATSSSSYKEIRSFRNRNEFTSPQRKKMKVNPPPLTKMTHFTDSMDENDSQEIDRALAKFFYACNIPFVVVESDWFLAFLRLVQPSYRLPSRKALAERLLDTVYEELKQSYTTETEGVLLVDGWKHSNNNTHNVLTTMSTITGEKVFVESYEFTNTCETVEELIGVCESSIKICKEKYNATIYGVISDDAKNMLKMGRILKNEDSNLMHVTCNTYTANLLAKEIANQKLHEDVLKVQRFFKSHSGFEKKIIDYGGKPISLPMDVRWCTYRDCLDNFLYNLSQMKALAARDSENKVDTDIKQLLFDDQFIQSVEEERNIYDPVCNLIDKCQNDLTTISEAVDLWLKLDLPDKFAACLDTKKQTAFSIHALAAYSLDPRYRGKDLSLAQQNQVTVHFIELFSAEELNDYDLFSKGEGIFAALNKKINAGGSRREEDGGESGGLLPKTYWSLASRQHPGIAKYAIRLLSIPASSSSIQRIFSQWSFEHTRSRNKLSEERSKKLMDIHYTLKMKETNKTDEY